MSNVGINIDWSQDCIILDDGYEMELTVGTGFEIELEPASVIPCFMYDGPELPVIDAEKNTDAWIRAVGWFRSEAW